MSSRASTFQSFFTTQDLHHYAKGLCTTDMKPEKEIEPYTIDLDFKCHVEEGKYDCLAGLNLEEDILYAFAKNNETDCEIVLLSFTKMQGVKKSLTLHDINGAITSMNFTIHRSCDSESMNEMTFSYKLLAGFKDGYLKVISLTDVQIRSIRLDVKPIVSIIQGNYQKFHNHNVSIVLAQDYFIYFVDIDKLEILYILRPNIVTCDKALSIEINRQYSYLMQTTKGGYIIFWKISEILNHLKKMSKRQNKKGIEREYNVLPARVNHSIAIEGILSCFFYGHIVAVITKSGILKLIAFNVKGEEQFAVLSQYKITQSSHISSACFYPKHNCIFISKSRAKGRCYIEKLHINQDLNIAKRTKIAVEDIDAINEFYLPSNSCILMCRGDNQIGIGFSEQLFASEKHPNSNEINIQKDY